jgi:hypothetical protein
MHYFGFIHINRDFPCRTAKELAKAASRALGSLMTKVNIAGGMTYKVYNKLYTSMI